MKIIIDNTSYLEVTEDNSKLFLTLKTKKDDKTTVLVTAKLNSEQISKLVTALISLKPQVD